MIIAGGAAVGLAGEAAADTPAGEENKKEEKVEESEDEDMGFLIFD